MQLLPSQFAIIYTVQPNGGKSPEEVHKHVVNAMIT
jgi:hypothetical protein